MGWESKANREYEERVIQDSLTRLSQSYNLDSCPLEDSELYTLAKRFREAMYGSNKKKERLEKFQNHLKRLYEPNLITPVADKLQAINNEIGYEEK